MTRTQLSLWVPPPADAMLEAIRRVVDPVQAALIPAHVTLCRDEELARLSPDDVAARLAAAGEPSLTLAFGAAERFGGHGIVLPCVAGRAHFHSLRARILGDPSPREHAPHLTLAHPRNPKAAGNDLSAAHALPVPLVVTFTNVRWIEQDEGGPWRALHAWRLGDGAHGIAR